MKRIDSIPTNLAPDALLRSLGITEPRDIDVEAIAYYVGLRVKRRCLKCCEAMITGLGNKGIISVNLGGMPQRERFSIAHELGHWAHHRGKSVACRSTEIGRFSQTNNVERAADQYAADLLMPWPMFKAECRKHRILNLNALKEVAGAFKTSLTATLIRMIESDIFPASMVVCHGLTGRKWHRSAPKMNTRWFPREELDADSFAFELLHSQNQDEQRFPRRIGADAWFDKASASLYEITEQSFRIPGEGIVTILNLDPNMVA